MGSLSVFLDSTKLLNVTKFRLYRIYVKDFRKRGSFSSLLLIHEQPQKVSYFDCP